MENLNEIWLLFSHWGKHVSGSYNLVISDSCYVKDHSWGYVLTLALRPRMSWALWQGLRSSGTISVAKLMKSTSLSYCITLCCCTTCHMKADISLTGGTRRCKEARGRGGEEPGEDIRDKPAWINNVYLQRLQQPCSCSANVSLITALETRGFGRMAVCVICSVDK